MASDDLPAGDFSSDDLSGDDNPTDLGGGDDFMGPFPDDILVDPKALGILRCLRMLAQEAAGLDLRTTATALSHAIEICAADQSRWPEPGGHACLH